MFPSGGPIYILGGGPSAGSVGDLNIALRGKPVVALNRAGVELESPTVIFWTDHRVWRWYGDAFKTKNARLVQAAFDAAPTEGEQWSLERYGHLGAYETALESKTLSAAHCAGYSAIHYAIIHGARKVYLLGFDGGVKHWHQPHPIETDEGDVWKMNVGMRELAAHCEKAGIEVWNASPNSSIRDFPICTLDEALLNTASVDRRGRPPAAMYIDVPRQSPWDGHRFDGLSTYHLKTPVKGLPVLTWGQKRTADWLARGFKTVLVENGPFGHWRPGSIAFLTSPHNGDLSRVRLPSGYPVWMPPRRARKLPGHDAPILVIGQMGALDEARSMPYNWPSRVAAELRRKVPGRPLWFRPHPKATLDLPTAYDLVVDPKEPLARPVLDNLWAIVTWSSSVGLVGLSEGIPVFNLGPFGWASSRSYRTLANIDRPVRSDPMKVESLFMRLAEIDASGQAQINDTWRRLWL